MEEEIEKNIKAKLLIAIPSCQKVPDQNFTEACKRD